MKRYLYAGLLCLAALFAASVTVAAQPNILLIVSEDNGPELGCYGDPYAKTPRLDHLADEGIRRGMNFTIWSVIRTNSMSCLIHQSMQMFCESFKVS